MTILYLMICFIIPNIVWQFANRRKLKNEENALHHIIWTYIFFIYCGLALYVAGIGTIWDVIVRKEVPGGVNLIPFSSEGALTYILNIIMFMPLGFMLPLVWKNFRSFCRVLAAGLGFSLLIEITQLFSLRLTDIDDLMMNTIGAVMGYLIWSLFSLIFRNAGKRTAAFTKSEPVIYMLLGVLGVFLLFNEHFVMEFIPCL